MMCAVSCTGIGAKTVWNKLLCTANREELLHSFCFIVQKYKRNRVCQAVFLIFNFYFCKHALGNRFCFMMYVIPF